MFLSLLGTRIHIFFSTDGRRRGPGIIIPGVQGLFWVIELCELKSFRGGGQRIEQSGLFICNVRVF